MLRLLLLMLFLRGLRLHSFKHALLTALTLYCMFTCGGMEIFIMASGMLVLLAFFPFLYREKAVDMPVVKRLLLAAAVFVWFVFLGAVQILPFLELLQRSIRSEGIQYAEAVLWSLSIKNLLYLFIPDMFWRGNEFYWQDQSWLKTIYTGMLPLLLAGFFFLKEGRRRLFVGCVMAAAFFLALGRYNPAYRILFEWVPALNVIRYPVKFFFIVIFFLCLSCGWGWDCFRNSLQERTTRGMTFILFFLFGFLGSVLLLGLFLYPEQIIQVLHGSAVGGRIQISPGDVLHNGRRVLFFTVLGAAWLYILMRKKGARSLGFYGITALLLADLFLGNQGFYAAAGKKAFHEPTKNMKALLQDEGMYRYIIQRKIRDTIFTFKNQDELLEQIRDTLIFNVCIEKKRFNADGFPVLFLKNYFKILTLILSAPLPDSTNLVDMMNIRYVLWADELNRPGYDLVSENGLRLYRNAGSMERAFLVKGCRVIKKEEQFKELLSRKDFNPRETVLFKQEPDTSIWNESAPDPRSPTPDPRLPDTVRITAYKNNSISLAVSSSCPQFLFLSESFYPGWKAFVGVREAPVYEANFAFRAIPVPRGKHTVTFIYDPLSFKTGAAVSAAALAAAVLFLVFYKRMARIKVRGNA